MPRVSDLSRRTFQLIVACAILVGATVRLWHLGFRGLWLDEGVSVALAQLDWSEFLRALWLREANMVLYYLPLRLWIHLGTSEFVLRSLSVLIAIVTIPLMALLGARLYSRKAGAVAACLLAMHVWHIEYSREARGYSLLVLLAVLGWLQLERTVRNPCWRNWFCFSVVSVASVYVNFFAVLNIAGYLSALLFVRPRQLGGWKRVLASTLLIVAGSIPAAAFVILRNVGQLVWIPGTRRSTLIDFADQLSGGWSANLGWVFVIVVCLCASMMMWRTVRNSGLGAEAFTAAIPVVGSAVPFLGLLLASEIQPSFVSRYLLFVISPFILGAAWLISFTPRYLFYSLCVLMVGLFVVPLPGYYRQPALQDFRATATFIAEHAQPGDAVFVWEPIARAGLEYYGRRFPAFPEFQYPGSGHPFSAEDVVDRIDPVPTMNAINQHDRIWLVFNFEQAPESYGVKPYFFQVQAEKSHRLVSRRQFRNMQVLEYVRP